MLASTVYFLNDYFIVINKYYYKQGRLGGAGLNCSL